MKCAIFCVESRLALELAIDRYSLRCGRERAINRGVSPVPHSYTKSNGRIESKRPGGEFPMDSLDSPLAPNRMLSVEMHSEMVIVLLWQLF